MGPHTQLLILTTLEKNSLAWCHDTVRLSHKLLLLKGLEQNMDTDGDGANVSDDGLIGSPVVAAAVHTPLRILQSQCKNYYYVLQSTTTCAFHAIGPGRDGRHRLL